jgi:acetyltransferase-like isoleucine patch superfamily enzyme
MFSLIKLLIKNPGTLWLKWLIDRSVLQWRFGKCNLDIKYMAKAKNVAFGRCNTLYEYSSVSNSSIGDGTYIGPNSKVSNTKIGNFCSIGPEVVIGCGRHSIDEFISSHPSFYSTAGQAGFSFVDRDCFDEYLPIWIGDDVWIGLRSIILDGVKIGSGAIVAAGSVVTKDVEEYSIVGGVPAKKIRMRFSEDVVQSLQINPWYRDDFCQIATMPKRTIDWLRNAKDSDGSN